MEPVGRENGVSHGASGVCPRWRPVQLLLLELYLDAGLNPVPGHLITQRLVSYLINETQILTLELRQGKKALFSATRGGSNSGSRGHALLPHGLPD